MISRCKVTRDIVKSRPKSTGTPILVRVQDEPLNRLDAWRRQQNDLPNRPETIRRLIELALRGAEGPRQRSPKARSKAHELANTQLDKFIDPSATDEERQQRKRRLLKGPREFREIRNEVRSKSKG